MNELVVLFHGQHVSASPFDSPALTPLSCNGGGQVEPPYAPLVSRIPGIILLTAIGR
jgi:hypothetical protein